MNAKTLIETAKALVADGKGLLAMDESHPACHKRFAKLGIPQTEEARRAYREMIVTAPGLGESSSGAILYDETIRQQKKNGTPFVKVLAAAGVTPGIKVDAGAEVLARQAALCQKAELVPVWHRYNADGYGEHESGAPFEGTVVARGWPLLTGERAHYELAAGRLDSAKKRLGAMESFDSEGGLIPEQVWGSPGIPERDLYFGRPSGSAMPLVWAHAEYLKLRRSLRDGRFFDLPSQTVQRYLTGKTVSPCLVWRLNHKIHSLFFGKMLRIETLVPVAIHWSADDWNTIHEVTTRDAGLGPIFNDHKIWSLGAFVNKTLPKPSTAQYMQIIANADSHAGNGNPASAAAAT